MKTVVGLFDNYSDAELAVRELESAGYDKNRISVFSGHSNEDVKVNPDAAADSGSSDVGSGAVSGAAVGGGVGLLAGVALAAIPGVGPILAIGPLAAGLAGLGLGAAAGGVV